MIITGRLPGVRQTPDESRAGLARLLREYLSRLQPYLDQWRSEVTRWIESLEQAAEATTGAHAARLIREAARQFQSPAACPTVPELTALVIGHGSGKNLTHLPQFEKIFERFRRLRRCKSLRIGAGAAVLARNAM